MRPHAESQNVPGPRAHGTPTGYPPGLDTCKYKSERLMLIHERVTIINI
jgi:hypothetical protein